MRVLVRRDSQSAFLGPYNVSDLPELIAKGEVSTDGEWITASGQSYRQLKNSPDWRPITDLLGKEGLTVSETETSSRRSVGVATDQATAPTNEGSGPLCICIGIVLSALGIYFLLVSPGADDSSSFSSSVVNLQRLYLGQTAAIAGAIFLAAGLRPRAR